jgi:hypothetical protein
MQTYHPVAESLPGLPARQKRDTPSHALGMPAFSLKARRRKGTGRPHHPRRSCGQYGQRIDSEHRNFKRCFYRDITSTWHPDTRTASGLNGCARPKSTPAQTPLSAGVRSRMIPYPSS